ncbi:hypothetical protein OF83DRAFT_1097713 [Amylostereum chailletii]|nr:hypothetical protein OF83DRAFT_1097713 [Amylostereum chailletii]
MLADANTQPGYLCVAVLHQQLCYGHFLSVGCGGHCLEKGYVECMPSACRTRPVNDPQNRVEDIHAWPPTRDAEKLADGHEQAAAIGDFTIPSFADMTLEKAIPFSLESGDTADVEEQEMLWMPDKVLAIKTILRSNAMSDAAIRLLEKVILVEQETNVVDISGFSLSPEQVMQLTPALSHDLQSLDLSNNPSLTIDAVRCILTAAPKLQKLWLLGCPITSDEIYRLVESSPALLYHMEALIHLAFLQPLVDDMDYCPYEPAFTFLGSGESLRTAALPYFTPTRIVRALTVLLRPMLPNENDPMEMVSYPVSSGHVPQVAFSGICFEEDQSWRERTMANIPQYSTERVGTGFGFVRWRSASTDGPKTSHAIDEDMDPSTDTEEAEVEGDEVHPFMPVPEVHDLASFLRCMASENRPLLRDEDVVVLEEIMQKLQGTSEDPSFMGTPLGPFEEKDIIPWFDAVDKHRRK